ncbi:RND superfamily putative drug exporter [Peribacillus deserti]|uniref:RND superfamily putative drug exporter n=1 Tax=Peribacillus deserti TaxID=673318 RepID=A0ABS2QKW5_9BACI|nr:MMPL family transporter [Peribacillus deserti]MBM7693404.1 RND superfamily putative drug exporter [Peribacillus deserti]
MRKLSNMIVRYRVYLVAVWVLLLLGLSASALKLPSVLKGDGFETEGEFKTVENELNETFHRSSTNVLILFEKQRGQSGEEFKRSISDGLSAVENLHIDNGILSPLKEDKLFKPEIAYASIQFDKSKDEVKYETDQIKKALEGRKGISITGTPIVVDDMNKASQEDLKRAKLIGLPVALIVLLLAFGSLAASVIPILIGGITVVISFGILSFLGDRMQLSVFVLNVIPMVGLSLSIDFALLFINRFREELKKNSRDEAVKITIKTAGKSILFSALCVFIGLAAMMVIDINIFQTVAIGGMVVVAVSVLSALTLLPSFLVILGSNINKWMILKPKTNQNDGWRKFAGHVMKHPIIIGVTAFVILLIGILPVSGMKLAIPEVDALPAHYESRKAMDKIEEAFHAGKGSIAYVVAERPGNWRDEAGLKDMKKLVDRLKEDAAVSSVESIYSITRMESSEQLLNAMNNPQLNRSIQRYMGQFISGDKLLLTVTLKEEEKSAAAKDWIRTWSKADWDYPLQFGGGVKFYQEIFDEIYNKAALGFSIILLSTFFILMAAFRSVVIPLKAIAMNILGLTSTFGILVWLFQEGHFGLESSDIALMLPVFVFSLVFGLSMDYEVFLISRIQEMYKKTGDNDIATVEGLASTSKIITSAALIMIVITGAFAFTGVTPVKQIGIGIAIAILIDATIIRILLVPSLMKLLGDLNWWMPFRKKQKITDH